MDLSKLDLLYRNAADASSAVSLTDGDGIIVHVNELFCEIVDLSKEQCIGKRHSDIFTDLDQILHHKKLKQHFDEKHQWRGEFEIHTKIGKSIWTDSTISQLKDEQGKIQGTFILSLDITEKKSIQLALGSQQQKLGFVLDSLQTAFWEWDMKNNKAWYNDNWPRMLGYEPDEMDMAVTAWADYVHPDDRARTVEEVSYHIKEKTPSLVCIQRFKHKNGRWIHVMTKGRVVERDENGRAIRFIGVNNDISMISRLEDFSQHVQDLAVLGIWDVDLHTQQLHMSRKTYQILGLLPQIKPPSIFETFKLFTENDAHIIQEAFEKLSQEGVPYDLELQLINGNWVRAAGRVDQFEGVPYRAFGIIQDINDSKKSKEALKTSQETLQLALEAGNFGVWDWDMQNDRAYWSSGMQDLFNVRDNTPQNLESFYKLVHIEDREKIQKEGTRSLSQDDRFDLTYRIRSKEDNDKGTEDWRWIRSVANIRRDNAGKESRLIGLSWDVTQQVEMQQQQLLAVKEAQKNSSMKSQFMATVSHEIRTPMSGVIGMTELLSETELSAEQREIVQTIKTCGENLLTLVNDILDYSKLEAEKMHLEKRPFNLAETIKNTLDLFQYKARQKGIQLNVKIGPGVPDIIVQDEARLYQILFNLVGNAVKFTSNGDVNVLIEKKKDHLSFRVADTGIGIPEDKLEVIFESFSQLSPGHQTDSYGTGLGLSISKSIVHLMGGDLQVTSKAGEGSCFYFDIEVSKETSPQIEKKESPSQKASIDLSKMRILVVEDNPINIKLLVSILNRHNVQVDTAEDGLVAVEKVKKNEYDIVFMDVQMPRLDGLSATKRIREIPGKKEFPIIIALTANVSAEHKKECIESGMSDFLPKPIRLQTIRSLLQHHAVNVKLVDPENKTSLTDIEAAPETILNHQRLLTEFAGFEDLLAQFVQIFLDNYATYLQQIDTEIANNQFVEVAKSVHTFKGIIGNFQSSIILKNLELLEDLAKSDNPTAVKQCFIDTTALIGKLVEEIKNLDAKIEITT